MKISLTEAEAFQVMLRYFATEPGRLGPTEAVANVLSDLSLLSDGQTSDNAAWWDWLDVVGEFVDGKAHFVGNTQVVDGDELYDSAVAFRAIYVFVHGFAYADDFDPDQHMESVLPDCALASDGLPSNGIAREAWIAALNDRGALDSPHTFAPPTENPEFNRWQYDPEKLKGPPLVSIDELFVSFQSAMRALVAQADSAGIAWSDDEAHAGWEQLAAATFSAFVGRPVDADESVQASALPVAPYGESLDSSVKTSCFVIIDSGPDPLMVERVLAGDGWFDCVSASPVSSDFDTVVGEPIKLQLNNVHIQLCKKFEDGSRAVVNQVMRRTRPSNSKLS